LAGRKQEAHADFFYLVDPTFQWAKTARPQGDMGQNFLES